MASPVTSTAEQEDQAGTWQSGRYAYVANTQADVITVIDLKEWKIADRLTAGKEPDGLGYSSLRIAE